MFAALILWQFRCCATSYFQGVLIAVEIQLGTRIRSQSVPYFNEFGKYWTEELWKERRIYSLDVRKLDEQAHPDGGRKINWNKAGQVHLA